MSDTPDSNDVMALAGLRRLVIHARDRLEATKIKFTTADDFAYNEHLRPAEIRRSAAMTLATEVLTLVIDCLPGDVGISADEAAERETKAAAAIERERRRVQAVTDQLEAAQRARQEAEAERDKAVEYQSAAEDEGAAWSAQWERLLDLARHDVPAAMRYLLAGGIEDETDADAGTEVEPDAAPVK